MAIIDDFFVDGEDKLPVLTPFAKNVMVLRRIIERDKGTEGDRGGRKKSRAKQEIAFVGLMVKRSYLSGRSDKDRRETIKKKLGLPSSWEADSLVEEAIEEFTEAFKSVESRSLEAIEDILEDSIELYIAWKDRNKQLVELLGSLVEDPTDTEAIKERKELIKEIRADTKELLAYLVALPKYIKEIQALRVSIDAGLQEQRKSIGNKSEGMFERDADLFQNNVGFNDTATDEDFIVE